ncbi:SpoIIE family protein phosphatase [Modestobacter sp. URMC 112]
MQHIPAPAGTTSAEASTTDATLVRAQLAIDAAGIGAFDWELGGPLRWDQRLIEMFGYDADSFDNTIESFNARVHPDDLPRVTEALQGAVDRCAEYEAEYRVTLPGGDVRWIVARGRALAGPDGAADRVIGVAYDVTVERGSEARVTRVLEAMPAGFYSLDREWRFTHVNATAERLLGHSRDELLGSVIWDAFPAAVNSAFEESYRKAVATGSPVSFDAYYPAPLDGWYELRAWPTHEGLSVYFLEVTDRRRAQEQAERSARRLAVLASVSAELAGSMDAGAASTRVARLLVPALADWCLVTVFDRTGRPAEVGSWHADPETHVLVERYARLRRDALPGGWAMSATDRVHVSGRDVLAPLEPGEARDLLARLAPDSVLALPMRGRGRTLGLLTLAFEGGRAPSEEDVATAQDVADRAGLALDNARLYDQQQQLAEGLQRSMLTEPPEPDHAEIVVRYVPAVEAARVGGDWYDAFLQPGGATMLVIGDVAGHDTAAAAAMGQLRSVLRGIATYSNAGPGEVLRGLDAAMEVLQLRTLATATIARFEQDDAERARGVTRMVWSNAGHLPPLAVEPDGGVVVLGDWKADLLLGVDPTFDRAESTVTLERGTTVVLYTDGLIERRDADLDAGLDRLRTHLAELAERPLQELCDELLERLVDGRPDDDVALVAVRLHPQDRPRPAEAGPNIVPASVPADA